MRKPASSLPAQFSRALPLAPSLTFFSDICDLKNEPNKPFCPSAAIGNEVCHHNRIKLEQRPTKLEKKIISSNKYPVMNKDCILTANVSRAHLLTAETVSI